MSSSSLEALVRILQVAHQRDLLIFAVASAVGFFTVTLVLFKWLRRWQWEHKMREIPRIVLTGGPCGGKTTGLKGIKDRLEAKGYIVYIAAEAATLLHLGGFDFHRRNECQETKDIRQAAVFRTQLAIEDSYIEELASRLHHSFHVEHPPVLLCDRGVLDAKCYCSAEGWKKLLKKFSTTEKNLKSRYDLVLHMTSTGKSETDDYSVANNTARGETKAQAALLCDRIKKAWSVHPNLKVIPVVKTFEEKLDIAAAEALQFLETAKHRAYKIKKTQ